MRMSRSRLAVGTTVAVKIIAEGHCADKRLSDRKIQARELDTILNLEHTNIIQLIDYAVYDAPPYATLLALEMAWCGTIPQVFNQGADEAQCRAVIKQILSALEYLHDNSIIHRDIEPENILVIDPCPASFYCKISDFTHAKRVTLGQLSEDYQGTPYMSLECARGQQCDHRTDVFACGKVAFWLLNGEADTPESGSNAPPLERIVAHLESQNYEGLRRGLGCSPPCTALISNMLSNSLSQRPTARDCLQHEWFTTQLPDPGSCTTSLATITQFGDPREFDDGHGFV
ncbi:hypothetical protein B0A55_07937 [Friedmanniomyces simplex]|uniref:Protein kinase domain-containing protein n=1 Tax=Friedmanniomyces simplex TaxID=329884 RepID=A0A4U0XHN5_9PEZI|nr:hypothetical protein B0A55_07937 [Friedmanniomyces simplex]